MRQERYASDPAFNDHLKASAVARRCRLLSNPAHRKIALHLQYISMQQGGKTAFASDFLKRYGNRIGSETMRRNLGRKTFNADLVREVREELGIDILYSCMFPLKGEEETSLYDIDYDPVDRLSGEYERRQEEKKRKAAANPSSYPAQAFIDYCMEHAEEGLEDWLVGKHGFCLNPNVTLDTPPPWFHELEQSLIDYLADRRTDRQAGKIVTSIGEQINDALDYAQEESVLVHINGVARMGKTYQIREWCAAHPGEARYVQVPSGNDDISFFRAIARGLGTACGSAMGTTKVKRNVEDAIQDSGIMLVFDEAHYLFPQYKDTRSSPRRINWMLTEIVNKGIPAAIISTPQFDTTQKAIVGGSGWASEQLDGRIAFRLDLPATLPESDLKAIARHHLPDAPKELIELLGAYARRSGKFIAGLEAVAKRARYLAHKDGREMPNGKDLETAMVQVDPAIAQIFEKDTGISPAETGKTKKKKPARRKQQPCNRSAQTVQHSEKGAAVTA